MIFTRLEVVLYFAAMIVFGWVLYPSEYTRGMMLRQDGDRSESIAFFRDYLRRNPYHKGATFALASAYEAAGRPEEGVPPLMAFYRHRKGDYETGKKLLRLMEGCGYTDQVKDFRWELIKDLKNKPSGSAESLEELLYRSFQEAAARQDDKATFRALMDLSELSVKGGSSYRDQMLRLLMERRQLDRALEILRQAAARKPEDTNIPRTIIRIHRMRGDLAAALAVLDKAIRGAPRNIELLADRAEVHVKRLDWDRAAADYERLALLEPKERAWVEEQARCLIKSGRFQEGIKVYEDLLARSLADRKSWMNMVYAYADNGHHLKAAEVLERFVRKFPRDRDAFKMLIYEYQNVGRIDRAMLALNWRLQAAPGDAEYRLRLIWMLRGEERYDETLPHYDILIRQRPRDRVLRPALAYVQSTSGRPQAAAAVFEEQIRLFPDDKDSMDKLTQLYVKMGEGNKAIDLLRRHFDAQQREGAK
ncbi:MAG: tetratricopeptide repeat protein [Elusimicrobiota bacterium]